MLKSLLLLPATVLVASSLLQAAPLTEAEVTKIINDVRVIDPAKGAHTAAINETIKDEIGLKTGLKSRSELLFQDNTLTRLGPETSFSFKGGTRDLKLEQGTMLLQVPKGLGGAKIRTGAVTAALTGTTIMLEYKRAKHIKVLVLEGSLRLSTSGPSGNSVLLKPGGMVMMHPDAKRVPAPVAIDLRRVMQTSSLVKMAKRGKQYLPSAALIEKEIEKQDRERKRGELVDTNLALTQFGSDTDLRELRGTVRSSNDSDLGFSHHR